MRIHPQRLPTLLKQQRKLTLLILGEIPPNDFINSCPFLSRRRTTHTTLRRHDGSASGGDERSTTTEGGKHGHGDLCFSELLAGGRERKKQERDLASGWTRRRDRLPLPSRQGLGEASSSVKFAALLSFIILFVEITEFLY